LFSRERLSFSLSLSAKMSETLDDSVIKAKYVPREVPGYLKDFPVNIFYLMFESKVTYVP